MDKFRIGKVSISHQARFVNVLCEDLDYVDVYS